MKKPQKLLRKLLIKYRDNIAEKPFTKERSQTVDCISVILESLKNENH